MHLLPASKDRTWRRGRIRGNPGVSGSRRCWQRQDPKDRFRGSQREGKGVACCIYLGAGECGKIRKGVRCGGAPPRRVGGLCEPGRPDSGKSQALTEHRNCVPSPTRPSAQRAAPTQGHLQDPHTQQLRAWALEESVDSLQVLSRAGCAEPLHASVSSSAQYWWQENYHLIQKSKEGDRR